MAGPTDTSRRRRRWRFTPLRRTSAFPTLCSITPLGLKSRCARPPGGPTLAWARTGDSAMRLQYFQHEFADLAATWQFVHDVKFYQVTKPDLIE